jgi:hypothetical protein
MTDKYAILNVTAIINMIEEARYAMWSDTEQTSFILQELVSILNDADSIDMQLGQVQK